MIYNGSDKHKIALFEGKQDKLTAGDNISLTPQSDGTVKISAEGGSGTVTDVLVDGVSVVNQDGEAEITMPSVPSDLDDLSDVNVSSLSDGEVLKYNATTEKWENGEAGGGNVDDVQMNGVSIVDANKIASFNNYVELTQAQYDALPASKLTDGVLYCIKDTGIVEGDKYAPIIYSLEEREVGVWTDGKPLYQKTVHINSLPSSTTAVSYPHNISNIDTICDSIAYIRWSSGNIMPLNTAQMNTTSFVYGVSFFYLVGKTDIQITVGMDRSSSSADVTIQYTKTTDVPGSGTWGTDGVPMVHYDGTEQIIGTWFGETLYEKTFVCQNISNNDELNMSSYNVKMLVNKQGIYRRYRATPYLEQFDEIAWRSEAPGSSNDSCVCCKYNYSAGKVVFKVEGVYIQDSSVIDVYLTLQYTKTT